MKFLTLLGLSIVLAACGGESTLERTDPSGLPNPIPVVVWLDEDLDGQFGVEEEPLSGVTVRLVDPASDNEIIDEAITDGNGEVELVGLQDFIPGYVVAVIIPDGYLATTGEIFPLMGHNYREQPVLFGIVVPQDS